MGEGVGGSGVRIKYFVAWASGLKSQRMRFFAWASGLKSQRMRFFARDSGLVSKDAF